jgi:hypothetical protein
VFFFPPICIRPEVAIYLFDAKVKHNVIINNQNILCHLKNNNSVLTMRDGMRCGQSAEGIIL